MNTYKIEYTQGITERALDACEESLVQLQSIFNEPHFEVTVKAWSMKAAAEFLAGSLENYHNYTFRINGEDYFDRIFCTVRGITVK